MEEYSRILSIEIKDFMAIDHEVITFDDSNILIFKGYNDTGKSAVLKAFGVILQDIHPRAQGQFIRDGQDSFEIVVRFDDGVVLRKIKARKGVGVLEMHKDDLCLFTNVGRDGRTRAKVEGIPQMIQDYLGMITVEDGYLNYRTRVDPMLLVGTTGAENYRLLNQVLQSEDISGASAKINKDRNVLNTVILSLERQQAQAEAVRDNALRVDEAFVELLEAEEAEVGEQESKVSLLTSAHQGYIDLTEIPEDIELEVLDAQKLVFLNDMSETLDGVNEAVILPEIPVVETGKLSALQSLGAVAEEICNLEELPELPMVDGGKLNLLNGYSEALDTLSGILDYPTLPAMDGARLEALTRLREQYSAVVEVDGELVAVSETSSKLLAVQKKIVEIAQKAGLNVVTCKGCGEVSLIDGEGHTHE